MFTVRRSSMLTSTGSNDGSASGAPEIALSSRATPCTLRQCARLGVSFKVSMGSSSASAARTSVPGGASVCSSSKPPWSSEIPSSRAEHNMPWLSTPRMREVRISSPPGNTAPGSAQGTRTPAETLGAPQTMRSVEPVPASTSQTRSLSASGCGSTALTTATTTFEKAGANAATSSTSRPAIVRRSASSSVVQSGAHQARNHRSGTFIGTARESADRFRRRGADHRRRSAASRVARCPSRTRTR